MVAFVSERAIDGIADKSLTGQDNVLKEWELAVDKLDANSKYIVPVLVGEYVDIDIGSAGGSSSSGKALKKFNAFGGLRGKPWPAQHSTTCATRTVKDTMGKFFAIQVLVLARVVLVRVVEVKSKSGGTIQIFFYVYVCSVYAYMYVYASKFVCIDVYIYTTKFVRYKSAK